MLQSKRCFEMNSSLDAIYLDLYNIWKQADLAIQLTESDVAK